MIMDEIERAVAYLETLFYRIYGTEECRVCREKIRCSTEQFVKKDGKIQCTQCRRYLEAVREKNK